MRVALVGYGRMGRAIEGEAAARGHRVVRILDPHVDGPRVRRRITTPALRQVEVAFEFTEPDCARENILRLLEAGVDVVSGTTGWEADAAFRREARASGRGLVWASNFSLGMALFMRQVRRAARDFGALGEHQPFVHEWHHAGKADCPSGTARTLAGLIESGDPRRPRALFGDPGGKLPPGAFHVTGTRAGQEPGTHVVGFDGDSDVIALRHVARSRLGFARGAVRAAEWVRGRRGVHTFDTVVAHLLKDGKQTRGR